MKIIKTCSIRPEAEMFASILEENSIPCLIQADDCGGARPYLMTSSGAKVLVRDEDFEKAENVLQSLKED